ncbi:MAG: hypothetical protein U0796_07205 [Gemmatales bacterium]
MRMTYRFTSLTSLLVFTGLLFVNTSAAPALSEAEIDQVAKQSCIALIPLEQLADPLRAKVTHCISKAQLFDRSKSESFPCHPDVYRWLLESPDASLYAWQRLGATKASIAKLPDGSFLGTDGQGGELRWRLIAAGQNNRIWFAEGAGRIGPLLPTMTIRALVFLHFQDVKGTDGRTGIKHRIEILVHYDSNALINKLTNLSAVSTGKKAVQQMELFFSGMAWYVTEHGNWTKKTLTQWAQTEEHKARLRPLLSALESTDVPVSK